MSPPAANAALFKEDETKKDVPLEIKVDAVPALAEMVSLIGSFADLFALTAKCLEDGFDLTAVDDELVPASASELRTVFKPTEKLALLASALRAADLEARARIGLPLYPHGESPSV